jgi:hypothetical protein
MAKTAAATSLAAKEGPFELLRMYEFVQKKAD